MSLTDDTKLTALAEDIVKPLSDGAVQAEEDARDTAVIDVKRLCQKIMEYVQDNAEVKGVKSALDTSLNTVFSSGVPVPTDGGAALQIAQKLATAGGIADKSTQTNEGTIE